MRPDGAHKAPTDALWGAVRQSSFSLRKFPRQRAASTGLPGHPTFNVRYSSRSGAEADIAGGLRSAITGLMQCSKKASLHRRGTTAPKLARLLIVLALSDGLVDALLDAPMPKRKKPPAAT